MDWAREIVLEITTASKRVVSAATSYARCQGSKNVQPCHFRLEKEMQKISVAARGILDVLDKASSLDGPPLDDRLEEWFSTDELPMCLETLNQMERMLRGDPTWMGVLVGVVNALRFAAPEDKIDIAVKLFDSRKNYFYFLLTTEVWNCEEPQQRKKQQRLPLGDELADQLVLRNITAMDVNFADNTTVLLNATNKAVVTDENETRQKNDLKKMDDIVRWLDGLTCDAKQKETFSLRQPDTCTWLDSTPEYKSWINGSDSFLWLQGKPGSGKTILASYVVDSLKKKASSDAMLVFFYCDFRKDRSTSACEVMRSILRQLLHHIRNGSVNPGDLLDSLAAGKESDTPILEDIECLASFVSQAAKCFTHQPLVVVDALDECKDIEKLLAGLTILAKGGMRLFVTSRPVQIIKDELRGLPFISMDKMTRAVSMDIALHVTRELDARRRLRDLESEMKTEIRSALCDRAQGMFRWVQCQIDTLNRCATNTDLRKALNSLPIGLDETYRRILVAIDTRSPTGKLALRALVWLVGALRPLRLSEIHEALTLNVESRTMNPDIGPMHRGALLEACSSLVTCTEDDALILSHFSVKEYLTGNLTRDELPRYHINLQRAHQHLAQPCLCFITLYIQHVDRCRDETQLSSILHTIDGRLHSANPSTPLSVPHEILGYIFTEGLNHLAFLGRANRVVLNDVLALQLAIQRYRNAWAKICRMLRCHRLSVPWPDGEHDIMFYILIAFASETLLRVYLNSSRNLVQPKDQTNPLLYAAHFGKPQQPHVLLLNGAKVNEKGLVVDASHLATPLQVAVSRQHDAMVDLLLTYGSVVPIGLFARCRDHNFHFPIRILRRLSETDEFVEWATEHGNILPSPVELLERRPPLIYERDIIIMIRRLVQVGVDPSACNSARKTALQFAIEGKYYATMMYLLLIGCPFPSGFASAMLRITRSERTSIVRLIVDAGIDVLVDDTGDTSLHLILQYLEEGECLQAIKMFVGMGCNPLVRNAAETTPFHLALEQGYTSVANYLLPLGTPPDALSAVVESRCPTTWKVGTLRDLIDRGKDVHTITKYGDTLLHRAVASDRGHALEVAEVLVCGGCNPFKCDVNGKTPFELALDRKLLPLADYLLINSTLPPPESLFAIASSTLPAYWRANAIHSLIQKGIGAFGLRLSPDGDTLLHIIILCFDESQSLDLVKLLVDAGCDPFRRDVRGRTPLCLALSREFRLVSDFLLSTGRLPPSDDLFAILNSALPSDWRSQTICSFLEKGIDAGMLSEDGNTLLHTAVLSLDESQCLDVAKLLVYAGCDPFRHDMHGSTPFRTALYRKFPLLSDFLLSTGGFPPSDDLFAILHSALPAHWRAQTMCSLIQKEVGTLWLSADGHTLLHATVLSLDEDEGLDVAKLLVGAGCDPFGSNTQGSTPFRMALDRRFSLLSDFLLSTGRFPPTDDLLALLRSELPAVWRARTICSLIRKGICTLGLASNHDVLLHTTVLSLDEDQCLDVVKILVGNGLYPLRFNTQGTTPLQLALNRRFFILVDFLLSTGGSPPSSDLFAILCSARPMDWRARTVYSLVRNGADALGLSADGDTLLHATVAFLGENQGVDLARLLVSVGCNPFERNRHGVTSFHVALRHKCPILAEFLLSSGGFPSFDDLLAIIRSPLPTDWNFRTIYSIIRKAAQVDAGGPSDYCDTLLHVTVEYLRGSQGIEMAKLLIGAGCNPFKPSIRGHSPFRLALARGSHILADILLSAGRPIPFDDLLAMIRSTLPADWKAQTLCSLLEKETDAGALLVSDDRGTLLHAAVQYLSENEGLNTARLLAGAGCDFSTRNKQGKTGLHIAAERGLISIVEYLLSLSQPLPDDILFSVLKASYQNQVPMLCMFIESGANARTCMNGSNLLHIAISSSTTFRPEDDLQSVVQILVDSGCDPSLPNSQGKTPLHLAVANGWVVVVEYLLKIQAFPRFPADILTSAFDERVPHPRGTCNVIQLLIHRGANVHIQAADGATLLHTAIRNTWCPPLPTIDIDLAGFASDASLLDILMLLVNAGCDPSTCDTDGRPPVSIAMTKGYVDVVEYLLPRTQSPLESLWNATYSAPYMVRNEIHGLLKEEIERRR